ncbi:MAG: bacteriophage CI repressor [Chlorobiaceae bacterium]|nr:bacteriophage CI repressor [Chlorobiaceae bacterium]NTV59805.1 bacteriophage CI repressor [Chlorobiaceae bacterium]
MNSNKLIERLEHALEAAECRVNAPAPETGGRTDASKTKKHRNPKLDLLIRKALSRGIDPHWLLTGEGCMYRKDNDGDPGKEASELRKMEHMLFKVYHRLRTVG